MFKMIMNFNNQKMKFNNQMKQRVKLIKMKLMNLYQKMNQKMNQKMTIVINKQRIVNNLVKRVKGVEIVKIIINIVIRNNLIKNRDLEEIMV